MKEGTKYKIKRGVKVVGRYIAGLLKVVILVALYILLSIGVGVVAMYYAVFGKETEAYDVLDKININKKE